MHVTRMGDNERYIQDFGCGEETARDMCRWEVK
jgi:hypothetical protein